MTYLSF